VEFQEKKKNTTNKNVDNGFFMLCGSRHLFVCPAIIENCLRLPPVEFVSQRMFFRSDDWLFDLDEIESGIAQSTQIEHTPWIACCNFK
jgi:hypothetical protein